MDATQVLLTRRGGQIHDESVVRAALDSVGEQLATLADKLGEDDPRHHPLHDVVDEITRIRDGS